MSTHDIAKKYHHGQTTIRRLLAHYGIPARSQTERTEYHKSKLRPVFERYKTEYRKFFLKKCQWCGKEMNLPAPQKYKKFCSDECCKKNARSKAKKWFCCRCGKEIIQGERIVHRKYCDECRKIARRESQIDRIERECGYCGKKMEVIRSRKHKYVYCDVKCMAKHYKILYTGPNSPAWNGGKRHYLGNWRQAQEEARERDHDQCQLCGITYEEYGMHMSVHHIKPYKNFIDKYEANQLSNLICLCEPCHRFVHSKKNTEQVYILK
jgi:hypothetical protein